MKILSYVELCSLDGTMLLVNKADVITRLNFYNIKENFMLEEYGIFRKTYSSNGFDLIFNSKEEFEITTRMHHVGHSDIETYCNEHVIGKIVVGFEFSGTPFGNKIETIKAPKEIKANIPLNALSLLKKQSIINIINAAAANVTYTLHATIYAKCASGGDWHTDIQAAINAKAAQGFTVTLISA